MRQKTNELEGDALDAAVALAEGRLAEVHGAVPRPPTWNGTGRWLPLREFTPSTNPVQGGEIIAREDIWLTRTLQHWRASIYCEGKGQPVYRGTGATPLIAAMRAFVASRLGDEFDGPGEGRMGPVPTRSVP